MAVVLGEGFHPEHAGDHARWRRQSRSPDLRYPPLPPDPFLESLAPDALLWNDKDLPLYISTPVLQPYFQELYKRSAAEPVHQLEERKPHAGFTGTTVFIDPILQQQTGATQNSIYSRLGRLEIGQNHFQDPRDRKFYPSRIVWGSPFDIPDLFYDLEQLAENGVDPVSSSHYHSPTLHLPMHSPNDLVYGFLQPARAYNDGLPLIREMNILGEGIVTKDVLTEQTMKTLNAYELGKFEAEWNRRIYYAKDKGEETARLANAVGVATYYSTNTFDFYRATPFEILEVIRSLDAYRDLKPI